MARRCARTTTSAATCCKAAGFAVVPFQAFGVKEDTGWFRLSVGAVSLAEIERGLPVLRRQ